jgi:hypothetical protein
MIKAKPMKPEDRLLKYTEFAAKFGYDNNLDMYGRHLNTIQYYCLDIIIPAIGMALILIYIVIYIVKKVATKVLSLFNSKPKSKKE